MSVTVHSPRAISQALPVSVQSVGRSFPERGHGSGVREVLADVTVDIAAGEIVAVIGASGCGKSTLLRQIGGLDQATSGLIRIDGIAVEGIDQRCAIGFQEPRLLPWRSIGSNVFLGLSKGADREAGRQRVRDLLGLVGLGEYIGLRPREISGGMAQRVSLARALARNPGVLLLDEPFGALDALTRLQMHDLLLELHAAEPTTVVLVTHDVDEALYLADRVVLLGRRDGTEKNGPSTVKEIFTVPGARPRDRGSSALAALRIELLNGLGVQQHSAPAESATGV